jgi:hypothetical protein
MPGRKFALVSLGALSPRWILRRLNGHVDEAPRSQQRLPVQLDRRTVTEYRARDHELQCVASQFETIRDGRRDMDAMCDSHESRAIDL